MVRAMANDRDGALGERLRRTAQMVSLPDDQGPLQDPFEGLRRRRSVKRRNERLLAGTVSMVLVGGLLAGTLTVLAHSQHGAGRVVPGAGGGSVGGPGA